MKHLVNQTGFTLVEMLITVAIIGIISAMAAPSFQTQIARMKQKEVATQIEMALKQARTDTMIHRSPVVLGIKDNQVITAQAVGSAKSCTIDSTNSATCKVTKTRLNEKVNIDVKNAQATDTIYFTVQKKTYIGLPTDTTPTSITNGISYGFCYNDVSGEKYVVTVDGISRIAMGKAKGETCS